MLLWQEGELCSTEIARVLYSTDNQIRRHMALLSKNQLVVFRQKELFHCYQLSADLPLWVQKTLKHTYRGNKSLLDDISQPNKNYLQSTAS
ncbi:hypothetical protein MACH26_28980 [Planctobacterium marinum]|uniref:HTH arsR-type domain-containing protein n=1 Tax=Planctobacterium marinum TaxID=1631968 RepID=A0AA48HRH7_9ALTE|nr:hypothetical protein MACH26_28980 [Planctobacterium marinum]